MVMKHSRMNSFGNSSNNSNLPQLKISTVLSSSNIQGSASTDNTLKKRYFFATHESIDNSLYYSLNDRFLNSENYFKEIPGVIIGKILKGPVEDPRDNSYVMHSIVGGEELIRDLKVSKNKGLIRPAKQRLSMKDISPSKNSTREPNRLYPSKILSMPSYSKRDSYNKKLSINAAIGNLNNLNTNKVIFELADNNKITEGENKFKDLMEANKKIKQGKQQGSNNFITEVNDLTHNNESYLPFNKHNNF